MDWQNDEFETLLRKFRLRDARPLTPLQPVGIRRYRVKIAAAAAVVFAIGASAAIVRQLSAKKDIPAVVEALNYEAPKPPATVEPVAVANATPSAPIPSAPPAKTLLPKLDPKVPEPLKQLTVVIPVEAQDAGQLSKQDPAPRDGRVIFLEACGSCHSPDLIGNSHFDTPQEYAAIVNRMAGMGASVSTQEASAIVDFLFQTYGKQEPGIKDRGQAIATSACTQCHGLDLLDGRRDADRDTYRSMVNKMVAYGAAVAPDQIDPLVEYLFRTYGKRLK